jgi:UDP-GlcNAc:undecaprenyl-phosphate GlcNAc-1-phosphate transferase
MTEFSFERPLAVFVAALLTVVVSFAGSRLGMESDALIDNPNERSSHNQAIPRAGGVAMLAGLVVGLFTVAVFSGGAGLAHPVWSFLVLAVLAGSVGVADDYRGLSPIIKFAGQFFVALLFVWMLGPLEIAPMPFLGNIDVGPLGVFITMFWIVGFMNVFNFMDGVNGIAAGAAATGLAVFAGIAGFSGVGDAAVIAGVAALAALAFLPANVMRARLFMGDCGSHFLGFMIAGLGIFAANASEGRVNALIIPMIFMPFIFDVAFTLVHRFMRGQNVLVAHREHLYQLILRGGASHGTVAALFSGLIAFCGAGAIVMLTIPSAWAWLAPVAAACVAAPAAFSIYRESNADGLLARPKAKTGRSGDAGERRGDKVGESG